jgi:tetratricopeptide (TPR) repeat protein
MKNLMTITALLFFLSACSATKTIEKTEASEETSAVSLQQEKADTLRHYPTPAIQRVFLAEIAKTNGDIHRALYEYQEALKYDTSSAFLYEQLGEIYILLHNFDDALTAYLKASELAPQNVHYLRVIAEMSYLSGKPELSKIYWEKTLQTEPDNVENYILYADYLAESKLLKDAIRILKSALELAPADEEILTKLFDYSQDINDYDQALQVLETLVILFPDNDRYRNTLMRMFFVREMDQRKIGIIEGWLEQEPDNLKLRMLYTGLLIDNEYWTLADEQIKKLAPYWQENVWISIWSAQRAESLGNDEAVAFHYERALQDSSAPIQAYQNYVIWLFKTDRYDEALKTLDQARERFPDELALLQMTALVHNYRGNTREAIHYYEKLLAMSPDLRDVKHTLAILYEQEKEFFKSDAIYKELIWSDADDEMALNNFSYSLAVRGIDLEKALEYVNRALAIAPDNGAYYDTKAWIYYQQGNYYAALEYVEKALTLDSLSSEIFFHHGEILLALEKTVEARVAFQKALEITPDYAEALKRLEELP